MRKLISDWIEQYIIVVPRSGCKKIKPAIPKAIAIGNKLFPQLFNSS